MRDAGCGTLDAGYQVQAAARQRGPTDPIRPNPTQSNRIKVVVNNLFLQVIGNQRGRQAVKVGQGRSRRVNPPTPRLRRAEGESKLMWLGVDVAGVCLPCRSF